MELDVIRGCYYWILFIGLILNSAMVGVAKNYKDGNDPDSDCKLQAVYFLKVAGGFLLALDLLEILERCIFALKEDEDAKAEIFAAVKMIVRIVIFIWGSVIIFGPYQDWTYNQVEQESKTFCEYTPYMFSFARLILGWITIPFVCCGIGANFMSSDLGYAMEGISKAVNSPE